MFPDAILEPDMTEGDELWRADVRESVPDHVERERKLLDDIFSTDPSTFLSITVHAWTISALLSASGYSPMRVAAGAVIPLLIKAEPQL